MRSLVRPIAYLVTCIVCLVLLTTCIKVEKQIMVSTGSISNVTKSSATAEGTIVDVGEGITQHGHVYGTSSGLVLGGGNTVTTTLGSKGSTGTFSSQLTNLAAGTTYYIRAYVQGNLSTTLGKEISFKTSDPEVPTLTTKAVTAITINTATSGGDISSDGGAPVTAKGVCFSTSAGPTINDSKTSDGSGTGSFVSSLSNLLPGTKYYIRAYATNTAGTGYGNEVSFSTSIRDFDGNNYNTVAIGTQLWMKENLATHNYNDGTSIPFVTDNTIWDNLTTPGHCWYNNSATFKNPYGALYNWFAVNTGKLCPTGWHVPTDAEWTTMENYLIANGYNYDGTTTSNKIAKALAATTNWTASGITGAIGNTDYSSKRNATGFTALPGGFRVGTFSYIGDDGEWWSATEYSTGSAWCRDLYYSYSDVIRTYNAKQIGFSVRCLKD